MLAWLTWYGHAPYAELKFCLAEPLGLCDHFLGAVGGWGGNPRPIPSVQRHMVTGLRINGNYSLGPEQDT